MSSLTPPKNFRELLEDAGTETKLYLRRLRLINKPIDTWTDEDQNLALRCGFEWMKWMQAVRNGEDWAMSQGPHAAK